MFALLRHARGPGVMGSRSLGGELVYVERVGVQEESRTEDRYRRAA